MTCTCGAIYGITASQKFDVFPKLGMSVVWLCIDFFSCFHLKTLCGICMSCVCGTGVHVYGIWRVNNNQDMLNNASFCSVCIFPVWVSWDLLAVAALDSVSTYCEFGGKLKAGILRGFLVSVCSGSIDGNNQLIIKGRFQQKQIENVLRRYISKWQNDQFFFNLDELNECDVTAKKQHQKVI